MPVFALITDETKNQWRIQPWTDQAAARIDQNLGLVATARSSLHRTRGRNFI